jgi:hypothetical protein
VSCGQPRLWRRRDQRVPTAVSETSSSRVGVETYALNVGRFSYTGAPWKRASDFCARTAKVTGEHGESGSRRRVSQDTRKEGRGEGRRRGRSGERQPVSPRENSIAMGSATTYERCGSWGATWGLLATPR